NFYAPTHLAFSAGGTHLACLYSIGREQWSRDDKVKRWNLVRLQVNDLAARRDAFWCADCFESVAATHLAVSPDGRMVAVGTALFTDLWDTQSRKVHKRLEGAGCRLAFSPNGAQLAATTADQAIRLWDVGSGKTLFTSPRQTRPVSFLAFGEGGR